MPSELAPEGVVSHQGQILILQQQPYLDGAHEEPAYQAHAQGADGKDYKVSWQLKPGHEQMDDESHACDWDKYEVSLIGESLDGPPDLAFPARLQLAREAAKLTQEQLAIDLGYASRQTINNYERGIGDPTKSFLERAAARLEVDPAWLAGWV